MDNTYNTQAVLSLCPGILGLEKGLERGIRTLAGHGDISLGRKKAINVVAYVEIEAFIIANLVGQMEAGVLDPAPIWTNVKTFDARPFRDRVHGIIGGYPCQPFSYTGERKGTEDPRHLWPYILEQIKIIGPEWVYFENVAGHLTLGYEEVRRSLSSIGYRVEEGIFTAEEVGAPHRRERLFIFATLDNADILRWGRRVIGPYKERSKSENKTEGSAAAVDNTDCQCQYRCSSTCGRWKSEPAISSTCESNSISRELADTNIDDSGTNDGYVQTEKRESVSEENKRQRNRYEFRPCNTELAHSACTGFEELRDNGITPESYYTGVTDTGTSLDDSVVQGLQGHAGNDSGTQRRQGQERSTTEASLFPAGQGTYQHEWEEPRTIESGMVYTINGYNFTEDLHRAIGNSVVEQTAELAFISLLEKHLNITGS